MMSRPSKELIERILKMTGTLLADVGMRKRERQIYTCELSQEIFGWLGLNTATHRSDGRLQINPVIGVRHLGIEKLVAEALGKKLHPYIPPTISTPLGYIMPEKKYATWLFGEGDVDDLAVAKMVEAIQKYGVPFMRSHANLDAIIEALESGCGFPTNTAYRLPVAYFLQGQTEKAVQYLRNRLATFGEKETMASQDYKKFAAGLSSMLEKK
jgi:hypothetical protein